MIDASIEFLQIRRAHHFGQACLCLCITAQKRMRRELPQHIAHLAKHRLPVFWSHHLADALYLLQTSPQGGDHCLCFNEGIGLRVAFCSICV
jgi:hypothetical protein